MAEKIGFQEKLRGILELAKEQGDVLSMEETEEYFEEEALSQEQIELVYQYLMEQGVRVKGYEPAGGILKESGEEREALNAEEQKYLDHYLGEIETLKESGEDKLAHYLGEVVEEARELRRGEVFLGDLIQEGNMRLVVSMGENPEKSEEEILKEVRQSMISLIEISGAAKQGDRQMVRKVSQLKKAVFEMEKEEERKVTLEEAAERLGITRQEAEAIWKLTGEEEN